MSDSMNCRGWSADAVMLKRREEIAQPHTRIVFLDDGGGATDSHLGGWTCYFNEERWWDAPPVRHGDGTTFSFADGHVEYHKWQDPRTIEFGLKMRARSEIQEGNPDLRWSSKAMWGPKAGAN